MAQIKVYSENEKSFIKLKDKLTEIKFLDKEIFHFFHDGKIFTMDLSGNILDQLIYVKLLADYYGSDNCHRFDMFNSNKRTCKHCPIIAYCKCNLNTASLNFKTPEILETQSVSI